MPWPGNAASPWIVIDSAALRSSGASEREWSVCRARTLPATTGFTNSRCDGFGISDSAIVRFSRRSMPSSPMIGTDISRVEWAPWWYLTSPNPPSGSSSATSLAGRPSNSARIDA